VRAAAIAHAELSGRQAERSPVNVTPGQEPASLGQSIGSTPSRL
jgi:hypothetical protein